MIKTRKRFDDKISNLKEDVLNLLMAVKKEHVDALNAMENHDYDISNRIVESDKEIRNIAESITTTAIWRIAQQQPFASDLRTIIGYMNIIRDLERISNYAKNISKFNVKFKPEVKLTSQITKLMTTTFTMMDLIGESIDNNDIDLAYKAADLDKKIDKEFKISIENIVLILKEIQDNNLILQYVNGMQQLKYIERLGDHLINICETIVYIITGKFYDLTIPTENQ